MTPQALATLVGGPGLVLLGMVMMSDGLKLAAGPALHRILVASTRTRWRGHVGHGAGAIFERGDGWRQCRYHLDRGAGQYCRLPQYAACGDRPCRL